ncbi:MAG TPA: lipopolysaccharide biosynthesis protein, partial [Chitinophagales bacterium]|nr:lipopolysaccharide biosynthesis protein [Chitinophagales bacterium]
MKHIVKSAFFITVGGALPLIASVLLLIPYTDNLNTGDYGALAIYISFALLVQILMNYGIDSYLSVHYYDYHDNPQKLRTFLAEITGGLLMYGLLLTAGLSLLSWLIFPLIFSDGNISFWPYGFMSILTGFFNAWFRMYVNIQVFADRARKYFWFGVFNLVVTVGISAWLVYTNPFTLVGPMWGRLLSGVCIFLLTFGFGLSEFGIRLAKGILREVKKYSTPIVIFSLLTWVLGYINNYILNGLATAEDVGVFDFALKCTLVIEYAGIGLLGTINPRIYQMWKKNGNIESTPEENRYYHAFSAVNILIIAINVCMLPLLIRLFVRNADYYDSIQLLPILCASFVFKGLYGMLVNPVFYFKHTKVLPRVLFISAVIQVVAGIIMIKYFGIWGAVWSYFLVRPIQVLVLWWEVKTIFSFKFNAVKMIWMPLLQAAIIIGMFYWNPVSAWLAPV